MNRWAIFVSALLLAAACGGTTQPDNAGPYACGKVCGGAPLQCMPKPGDGGACPAGFTDSPNCLQGSGGCVSAPCTPPDSFCSAQPACVPPQPTAVGRDEYCSCG